MKCPLCEIHTKCEWLGDTSFQCLECGFYFLSPKDGLPLVQRQQRVEVEFNTCPYCYELTDGIGANLENLDNVISYNKKPRMAHPECIEQNTREENNRKIIFDKQIALLDRVALIPCPHCGELGIYLDGDEIPGYSDTLIRPYWNCATCDTTVDKHWLMQQVKAKVESIVAP